MKLTKALFVLALALTLVVPAYAETQNVKVSGSIDMYGFYRNDYDLRGGNDSGSVAAGTAVPAGGGGAGTALHRSEGDSFFRSNTQIQVAADLTDNVSTVVNIVNQRDWNADPNAGTTGTTTTVDEFDVELDLAYVQMKEIFYSPLTLTLGRQDIWFGRGFIIGNNSSSWDPQGITLADEYSVTTAFDAIRATLDFNPWTVDLVYSKINENAHDPEDDHDLYVANVNYKFAEYNAVAEGYFVLDADRAGIGASAAGAAGAVDNETDTLGGRVQFDPIAPLTLGAELAYQFGDYFSSLTTAARDREAWGLDLFATYRFADNPWKPEVTLEYVSLGGDSGVATTTEFGGWNSLYRGKFWTAYADFREFLYSTGDANDQAATTNNEFIHLKGAFKPAEDILLEAAWTWMWNEESIAGRSEDLGYEIDLQATYDYTEDVTFGLLAGWFVPGDQYTGVNDETATDLVSSVKVSF